MIHVVTFLWKPKPGYRSLFTFEHVNTMYRMVKRNYPDKMRFHLITDATDRRGLDDNIGVTPLWSDYANVEHPHGAHNPSCYRRLKLYSDWARQYFGPRIVSIDLDMVITGDLRPLWNRAEPFVFWADQLNPHGRINGAMQLITPGVRDEVWSRFDPTTAQLVGRERGKWGSDQGWLAHMFPEGSHGSFGAADGCFSWRVHCEPKGGVLPPGARVVNFHGPGDPWTLAASIPWIKEHTC